MPHPAPRGGWRLLLRLAARDFHPASKAPLAHLLWLAGKEAHQPLTAADVVLDSEAAAQLAAATAAWRCAQGGLPPDGGSEPAPRVASYLPPLSLAVLPEPCRPQRAPRGRR